MLIDKNEEEKSRKSECLFKTESKDDSLITEVIQESEIKIESDVTEKSEILKCEDTEEKSDTDQNSILTSLITPKISTKNIQVIRSENLTLEKEDFHIPSLCLDNIQSDADTVQTYSTFDGISSIQNEQALSPQKRLPLLTLKTIKKEEPKNAENTFVCNP